MRLFFAQTKINSIPFTFLSTTKGLCHVSLRSTDKAYTLAALKKKLGVTPILEEDTEMHRPLIKQIQEYLAGKRQVFSVAADLQGTRFQKAVWAAIKKIPYGQTYSYQQIAKLIRKDRAARAVGQAARANPLPLIIPCHRVVGSSGQLVGFSAGLSLKAKLLGLENRHKENSLCPFPKPD